jgi:hypothetical protein
MYSPLMKCAALFAWLLAFGVTTPAFAQELASTSSTTDEPGAAPRTDEPPPEDQEAPPDERPHVRDRAPPASPYRNPQGSITFNGFIGAAVSSSGSRYGIGAGVGYAVLTGVLPGLRALVIAGDGIGAELAATLTLTPPLASSITPFAIGEAGRRFDPIGQAWLYGAGAGIYIGEPAAAFGFQIGYMFRRIVYADPIGSLDASGPIIAISLRF